MGQKFSLNKKLHPLLTFSFGVAKAAGGTVLGSFRKDADTATATQISGANWETSANIGELAMIKLPAISQV